MKWVKTDSGYQTECGRGKIVKELDPSKYYPTAIWVSSIDGEEFDFAEEKLKLAKHAVEMKLTRIEGNTMINWLKTFDGWITQCGSGKILRHRYINFDDGIYYIEILWVPVVDDMELSIACINEWDAKQAVERKLN